VNKFLERFKQVCKDIDKGPKQEIPNIADIPMVRYNIHRRSLPVGLDKPVAFFLTKPEASMLARSLKARTLDNGSVIYYDVVANTGNESVYPRGGQIVIERGFGDLVVEEKLVDVAWVG
jgi:hypothetical protein